MDYLVIKTNKRTVTKSFSTISDLNDWSESQRYSKGVFYLYKGTKLIIKGDGQDLNLYTTDLFLSSTKTKKVSNY